MTSPHTVEMTITNKWQSRNAQRIAKQSKVLIAIHNIEGVHIGYVMEAGDFKSVNALNDLPHLLSTFIGTNRDFYTIEKRMLLIENIQDLRKKF